MGVNLINNAPGAPAAIGPYSQAVKSQGFLFCSGQIPIDPATGKIEAADVEGQTKQVFANIRAVLASQGISRFPEGEPALRCRLRRAQACPLHGGGGQATVGGAGRDRGDRRTQRLILGANGSGGALVAITLDASVVIEKIDPLHIFQFGENPGGKHVASILGKDDIISDVNARVEGVATLRVQEEEDVPKLVRGIDGIEPLKHGRGGEP